MAIHDDSGERKGLALAGFRARHRGRLRQRSVTADDSDAVTGRIVPKDVAATGVIARLAPEYNP
ncbi:hypothetical protein ACW5DW_07495 [Luteimonas sp. A482]